MKVIVLCAVLAVVGADLATDMMKLATANTDFALQLYNKVFFILAFKPNVKLLYHRFVIYKYIGNIICFFSWEVDVSKDTV